MAPWLAFCVLVFAAVGLGGWCLPSRESRLAKCVWAVLCGIVFQAMLGTFAAASGCSFPRVFWGLTLLGGLGLPFSIWQISKSSDCSEKRKLAWFHVVLAFVFVDALAFGSWAISNTPLSSEDGIFHWSGRARYLFGGVNWSWDPADENYLGLATWNRHYPLLIPVWRAVLAGGSAAWTEVAARADGLVYYAAFIGSVWSLGRRLSASPFWAASAAIACACQPLLTWHVQAGNADLAMAAFLTAAVNALVRERWVVAGLCASGAVLTKNEGLLVYLPAMLLGLSVGQLKTDRFERKPMLLFLIGLLPVVPWLLFRLFNRFQLSPSGEKGGFQPDAILPFLEGFWLNPTSYCLWVFILISVLATGARLWAVQGGKELLSILLSSLGALGFVFVWTEASKWLQGDITLQRILMQLSGLGIVAACSGWSLLESSLRSSQKENLEGESQQTAAVKPLE